MFSIKMKWFLVGLLCLALWPVQALAQQVSWEHHMQAGITAYRQGKYGEAEKQWIAGLEVAKSFGTQDPRVATSLNNPAGLYDAQGRYAEAEPLFKRSLGMWRRPSAPTIPMSPRT